MNHLLRHFPLCLIRAPQISTNILCVCHCFVLRVYMCCLSCNVLPGLLCEKSKCFWDGSNGRRMAADKSEINPRVFEMGFYSIVVFYYTYQVCVLYLGINFDHFKKYTSCWTLYKMYKIWNPERQLKKLFIIHNCTMGAAKGTHKRDFKTIHLHV